MTTDETTIEFQTDNGADVSLWAESGTLFARFDAGDISVEKTTARVVSKRGDEWLDCGYHRDDSDEKHHIHIPVGERSDAIKQLREDSKDDSPLTYEVEQYTKTTRAGGWGKREITKERLVPSKSYAEMTEHEQELKHKVDTDRVPADAEPGDILTFDDLLDDARTAEEKEQEAVEEAAATGDEVVINKSTTSCNDSSKECNLDHVTRVATPEGGIETRRTHTY